MSRFLLDTDICIRILRDPKCRVALRAAREEGVAISAISLAELAQGALASAGAFAESVAVLPFDADAAQRFPAARKARGKFDRLIAAHALALGATLVTHNVRDFREVPGLRIEDWTL
jgi:tRNA(fMet)-specific endonuclease VapC